MVRSRSAASRVGLAAFAASWLAVPTLAGLRYTVVTESAHGDTTAALVEADDERVRVEFQKRGDTMFGRGDYLVTEDGGQTIYWVEPRKRRYAEVDFERLARMVGRLLEGIPAVFWVRIEEPEVRKIFVEDGPTLLGLQTRHTRHLMTYRQRSRTTLPVRRGVKSTRQETWNQVVQDVWLTDAIPAPRYDFWLRQRFRTGYEDLDRLLSAEASMLEGFPLRVETVTVSSTRDLEHTRVRLESDRDSVTQKLYLGEAGRRPEIDYARTVTEVTALETTTAAADPERFRPPAAFARREP